MKNYLIEEFDGGQVVFSMETKAHFPSDAAYRYMRKKGGHFFLTRWKPQRGGAHDRDGRRNFSFADIEGKVRQCAVSFIPFAEA